MSKRATRSQDCTLSERIGPGEKTLAALYAEYYPQIRRYITSRIIHRADAHDLTQDVFVEFLKGNGAQEPEAYIFGIARNLVARYHRNQRRKPSIVQVQSIATVACDRDTESSQQPEQQLLQLELIETLTAVVAKLPPKTHEAIKLRFTRGLSLREAAEKAGCSQDVFLKRVRRATKALDELTRRIGL